MSEPFPPPEPPPDRMAPARPAPATGPAVPLPASPRITAAAEVVLCSGIPTQLMLGGLFIPGMPLEHPRAFMAVLIADTCVLIGLMVLLLRLHGEHPRDLWLGGRRPFKEAMVGIGLIPAIFVLVVVMLRALQRWPGLHDVAINPLEALVSHDPFDAALFALTAMLAGGVREELQRAFLLRRFEQHLGGPVVGVVLLSVAFGAGHRPQGWDVAITTGVLGAIWAVCYLWRRSVVAPLVSHAGFNGLEVLRVFVVGGR